MAILTIDEAVFPSMTLSKQAGGSLDAATYYYRIAAINARGECCAGPVSSLEITAADVIAGDRTIRLTFDYPGWASNCYVYRNTSDSWSSGSLLLDNTVASSPYDDDGSLSPGAGVPNTFEADVDWGGPATLTGPMSVDESSLMVENDPPGREGGLIQYLGSVSDQLTVTGEIRGASAKSELDKLRTYRSHGNPLRFTLVAYTLTWIDDDYFIRRLSWSPVVGRMTGVAAAAQVVFVLELLQYVA